MAVCSLTLVEFSANKFAGLLSVKRSCRCYESIQSVLLAINKGHCCVLIGCKDEGILWAAIVWHPDVVIALILILCRRNQGPESIERRRKITIFISNDEKKYPRKIHLQRRFIKGPSPALFWAILMCAYKL